jgi:hypothetical protein
MTLDCRSIGTSSGEVSGFREDFQNKKFCAANSIPDRPASIFLVHLSNQEFGNDVGDARTTKFLRRDSDLLAARIRGLNRLCSTRDIITVTKRPEDTGPIRVSAKSQIGARPIS